nr:hypothetical protein [Citrobacter freundii]
MALRLSGLHYYTPVGLIRRVASHQAHFALPFEEPVPAVDQRGKHGKERRIFQRILKGKRRLSTVWSRIQDPVT